MEIVVADAARTFIEQRGGTLYVRSHDHRCCTNSLTLLDATTVAPTDPDAYETVPVGSIRVGYRSGAGARPERLEIELRGVLRRHAVAYWNGCAFRI